MIIMDSEEILNLVNNDRSELHSKAQEIKTNTFGNIVTFSRNLFVPVTHQCRNRCGYCSFVSDDSNSWITPENYQSLLKDAKNANCKEILLTLGEKPEEKYQSAKDYLNQYGFDKTVNYVNHFCELALNFNLLPHSNLGVLTFDELAILKENNASMGLMLESSSYRLMDKNQAHYLSPGKDPSLRLDTLIEAGKLKIPFTSGILIGIGETWEERIQALFDIKSIQTKYSNIQEVIVQNFNPQPGTPMSSWSAPLEYDVLLSISIARIILQPSINLQIPPNLNKYRLIDALNYGANDLGGISPISIDYINPNHEWHKEQELAEKLNSSNYELVERLPVYPSYEKYLNTRIRKIIEEYRENEKALYSSNR